MAGRRLMRWQQHRELLDALPIFCVVDACGIVTWANEHTRNMVAPASLLDAPITLAFGETAVRFLNGNAAARQARSPVTTDREQIKVFDTVGWFRLTRIGVGGAVLIVGQDVRSAVRLDGLLALTELAQHEGRCLPAVDAFTHAVATELESGTSASTLVERGVSPAEIARIATGLFL